VAKEFTQIEGVDYKETSYRGENGLHLPTSDLGCPFGLRVISKGRKDHFF